jgi:hypothetical protein
MLEEDIACHLVDALNTEQNIVVGTTNGMMLPG